MKQVLPHRLTAPTRWAIACMAVSVALHPQTLAYSATLFYLSSDGQGQNAAPVAPQETLKFLPGDGSLYIWVQPGTLLSGISLNLETTGSAVRFTGSTVHNPSVGNDTRWLPGLIRNGTVTDTQVSRIEGGALVPLVGVGTGIGATTSAVDPLYEANGGFLFATVDFAVLNPTGTAMISISIGHNLVSDMSGLTTSPLFLGVADGPVANSPGATGTVVDLRLVPKPLHAADFDSDGDVDGRDMLIWQRGYGITTGGTRDQGDATGDAQVDVDDLALWATEYGTPSPSIISAYFVVPETGTLNLAICNATISLVFLGRRRG